VNPMKILGILLIVGASWIGVRWLQLQEESHEARLDRSCLSVTDKETVNVPIWVGVGAIVIGGLLLVFGSKKG